MKCCRLRVAMLLVLMAAAIVSPLALRAQSDGFFRHGDDVYNDRGQDIFGITNYGIGEEVPIGSGLLVMLGLGVCYAAARGKRMRNGMACLAALVMLLGMTQCKKNVETLTPDADGVKITLRVDDGSKVSVDPMGGVTFATVTFEDNDVIYVGNDGKYIGSLVYDNGAFSGVVTPTSTDDYLHFYFLGNKEPQNVTTTSFDINIIDQTEKYPVISYGRSRTLYDTDVHEYNSRLVNYCAIVKFTTTDLPTATAVTLLGMNNKVSVDFSKNVGPTEAEPYSYSMIDDGQIKLHAESNTERWAILLPQAQVTNTLAFANDLVTQNPVTVPQIEKNQHKPGGISLSLLHTYISVSATKKVRFSQGNLQYLGNANGTGTWRFAEHQYDFMGDGPSSGTNYQGNVTVSGYTVYNTTSNNDVARDLFSWGTSGYNSKTPNMTSTSTSSYYAGSLVEDDANYDWGVYHSASGASTEKISNGGSYSWRLLTSDEWSYAMTRTKSVQTQPTLAETKTLQGAVTVNGVKGVVVLPDNWTGRFDYKFKYGNVGNYTNRTYTVEEWAILEKLGCVFLPSAHVRKGTSEWNSAYLNCGHYWSSTTRNGERGYDIEISNTGGVISSYSVKYLAQCVRLVRDIE